MRTTLTIDDDVAVQLERVRRSLDLSLKDLVNDALRRGLREMSAKPKKRKPFRTKTYDCGRALISVDDDCDPPVVSLGRDGCPAVLEKFEQEPAGVLVTSVCRGGA